MYNRLRIVPLYVPSGYYHGTVLDCLETIGAIHSGRQTVNQWGKKDFYLIDQPDVYQLEALADLIGRFPEARFYLVREMPDALAKEYSLADLRTEIDSEDARRP